MADFDTCDYYDCYKNVYACHLVSDHVYSPAEVESILRERVPSWLEEARRG